MDVRSTSNTEYMRVETRDSAQASSSLCQFMSGGLSEVVPRLPIPNRTVKRLSADDSVAFAM